jgi:hypothetical protein
VDRRRKKLARLLPRQFLRDEMSISPFYTYMTDTGGRAFIKLQLEKLHLYRREKG